MVSICVEDAAVAGQGRPSNSRGGIESAVERSPRPFRRAERGHWTRSELSGLRSGSALVPMVQTTDLRELDDVACFGGMHWTGNGAVLVQRQVGS